MEKKVIIGILFLVVALFFIIFYNWENLTGKAIQEINCTDSDGGIKHYEKGITKGKGSYLQAEEEYTDYCFNNTANSTSCYGYGCSVREYYCGFKNFVYDTIGLCPNGCKDGTCLTKQASKKNETLVNETAQSQEQETEIQEELEASPPEKQTSWFNKIIDFFKKTFG